MDAMSIRGLIVSVQEMATDLVVANETIGQSSADLQFIVADASVWLSKFNNGDATLEDALQILHRFNWTERQIRHLRWAGDDEMVKIAKVETPDDVLDAIRSYGNWVEGLETKTFIRLEEQS